jgi:hypothetical protein
MDNIIKESQWIGELGNLGMMVKYRVSESGLNHLYYIEKARQSDPTYFRRISNGYNTKQDAIREMNGIVDAERMVESINRKSKKSKPKIKKGGRK